jgi:hypothetical protein
MAGSGPAEPAALVGIVQAEKLNVPQRQLGRHGPTVAVIGFGAWPIGGGLGAIDDCDATRTLHHAFERGPANEFSLPQRCAATT